MIDIRTSFKDGQVWYTPYKKIIFFFWIKIGIESTDFNQVVDYLDNNGY